MTIVIDMTISNFYTREILIDEASRRARAYLGDYITSTGRASDEIAAHRVELCSYYIIKEWHKLIAEVM